MNEGRAGDPSAPLSGAALDPLRAFRARGLEYLQLGYDRVAAARFVAFAAADLKGPALDIGTGKGLLAVELARRRLDVVSLDLNDDERDLARLLASEQGLEDRISFVQADAVMLPHGDGRFGCVAMMDVMHHLSRPVPVLHEMARVVAPGGSVVIADFDEEGFDLVARVHRESGREHARTPATVALASEELERLGFDCTIRTNAHFQDLVVLRKNRR